MGHYIGATGNYYIGQRVRRQDIEVPPRPSEYHAWDGKDWTEDTAKMQAEKDLTDLEEMIKKEMRELALASLKSKGLIPS